MPRLSFRPPGVLPEVTRLSPPLPGDKEVPRRRWPQWAGVDARSVAGKEEARAAAAPGETPRGFPPPAPAEQHVRACSPWAGHIPPPPWHPKARGGECDRGTPHSSAPRPPPPPKSPQGDAEGSEDPLLGSSPSREVLTIGVV